jgi:hypothetical protein
MGRYPDKVEVWTEPVIAREGMILRLFFTIFGLGRINKRTMIGQESKTRQVTSRRFHVAFGHRGSGVVRPNERLRLRPTARRSAP